MFHSHYKERQTPCGALPPSVSNILLGSVAIFALRGDKSLLWLSPRSKIHLGGVGQRLLLQNHTPTSTVEKPLNLWNMQTGLMIGRIKRPNVAMRCVRSGLQLGSLCLQLPDSHFLSLFSLWGRISHYFTFSAYWNINILLRSHYWWCLKSTFLWFKSLDGLTWRKWPLFF